MKFAGVLITLLMVCLLSSLAQAQNTIEKNSGTKIQGLIVQAESFERDLDMETVELQGNVQIIYAENHLRAQRVKINLRAKTLDAFGEVYITNPRYTIAGQRVLLDYEGQTGIIYIGFVQSGNVIFEGTLIKKNSDTDYIADDAKYTTCTTCPEAWSFTGKKIRAELGGYAYIKNSILHFGGVPVFWMPYLVVPLKSERQTGLLSPDFEQSGTGGFALSESLFWAINRSQDATITLTNYELRGLKGLLNYRYVLNQNSHGELDTGMLSDRVFATEERLNLYRSKTKQDARVDRWFLKYNHYYELPDGFIHRAQINNASDLQYPKDFPLETKNYTDPAMENRMSLTKNSLDQHYSVDISYYKNMLQSDPLTENNDSVHRLPEIRFSQTQQRVGNSDFLYAFDVDYVNFARSGFGYDDIQSDWETDTNGNKTKLISRHLQTGPTNTDTCKTPNWESNPDCYYRRDGVYDPNTDLIRTGQRLDIQPSIYRSIQYDSVEILPKVSYRETQYQFNIDKDRGAVRRYALAEVAARTTFSGVFGDTSSPTGDRYKHEIQPEISATTVPWIYQSSHPFFGVDQTETPFLSPTITDADFYGQQGLQFDFNDRLYDRKRIGFAVVNKFTKKTWNGDKPQYLQFINWRVAQSYDAYQAENSARPHPLSELISDLKVRVSNFEFFQTASYFPYQQVTNSNSRVRLSTDLGDYVDLGYILSYPVAVGEDYTPGSPRIDYRLSLKKSFPLFDVLGALDYDPNPNPTGNGKRSEYLKAWGYGAQFKLPGNCWYLNIVQYHPTDGDTIFKFNFGFVWDGEPKPPLPSSVLNVIGF